MQLSNRIREDRLLAEFLEIVQIDSPVFHEGEFADALECKLASLGFRVVNDHTGPSSGNLIATLPGTIDGGKAVALSAHLDTVEPGRGIVPVVREGVVWSSGNTVLGADNKASLAAILETMKVVQGAELAHPDIELRITWGEEFGLAGAAKLDVSPLRSRLCFTLDGVSEIGTVITCAPIHYSFKPTIKGRAAHAGAAPEKGINALVAAAKSIARMRLGRIDGETTANVGLLQAGTARNAVPALAELEGETPFWRFGCATRVVRPFIDAGRGSGQLGLAARATGPGVAQASRRHRGERPRRVIAGRSRGAGSRTRAGAPVNGDAAVRGTLETHSQPS